MVNDDEGHHLASCGAVDVGVKSVVTLPTKSGDLTLGVVTVSSLSSNHFTPDRVRLLSAIGDELGVLLESARLFEEVRVGHRQLQALSHRLVEVQEEERRHLARELHDEIGQMLTSIKFSLERVPSLAEVERTAKLLEVESEINDLMGRVRELSLDLRPSMLDDLGLLPALTWLFKRHYARTQVKVICDHEGVDMRFTPETEVAAYRISQEALTNVARHAGTQRAHVVLFGDQHKIHIRISDEGNGFDPDEAPGRGDTAGVAGMRERALLLGGWLVIESVPGEGTHVTAELSLKRPMGGVDDDHPSAR